MSRIFLSYSRQDSGPVNLFVSELEQAGHEVWLDRLAIQGGAFWQEQIVKAVGNAEIFLLVVSSHSVESPHVERELGLATLKRKRIVAVILDCVNVPDKMEYALAGVERIPLAGDFQVGTKRVLQILTCPTRQDALTNPLAYEERVAPAPRRRWRECLFVSLLIVLAVSVEYFLDSRFGLAEGSSVPVLALVILTCMGANALRARLAIRRLRCRGKVIFTQYKGVRVSRSNGGERIQIVSQWEDDEKHELRVFYSDALPSDASELMDLVKIIRVFVDPANPQKYHMDLSFLDPRGGVPVITEIPNGESSQLHSKNAGAQVQPTSKQSAKTVFLSHSGQEAKEVVSLTHDLEEAGYTVLLDPDCLAGTPESDEAVVSKIGTATVFLLVLSPFSVDSKRVEKELMLAVATRKKIVPVILRGVQLPPNVEYALVGLPRIDLSVDFKAGFGRLLAALSGEVIDPLMGKDRSLISIEWMGGLLGIFCFGVGGLLVAFFWSGGTLVKREYLVVLPALAVGSTVGGIFGVGSARRIVELEDVLRAGLMSLAWAVGMNVSWFPLGLRHAWLALAMGAAGAAAWTAMKAITTSHSIRELKKRGTPLLTDYKCVLVKRGSGFNLRDRWQLVSQWRDPKSRHLYLFYSKELSFDLADFVPTKTITVFTEPGKMQNYCMDLSFLPGTSRGLFNL